MVEQRIRNAKVGGSTPLFGTNLLTVTPLLIDIFAIPLKPAAVTRVISSPALSKPSSVGSNMRGFTLLEMLVVLTVIALLAGIAVPNFMRMMQSFTAATKWSALLNEIDGLSYRAYVQGQPIQLSAATASQLLSTLPQGWTISVETGAKAPSGIGIGDNSIAGSAISYRENGWCNGGRITFTTDEGARRTVDLAAPRCAVAAS